MSGWGGDLRSKGFRGGVLRRAFYRDGGRGKVLGRNGTGDRIALGLPSKRITKGGRLTAHGGRACKADPECVAVHRRSSVLDDHPGQRSTVVCAWAAEEAWHTAGPFVIIIAGFLAWTRICFPRSQRLVCLALGPEGLGTFSLSGLVMKPPNPNRKFL